MTDFEVVYRDPDYAVVIKPYGVLSEYSQGKPNVPELLAGELRLEKGKPG